MGRGEKNEKLPQNEKLWKTPFQLRTVRNVAVRFPQTNSQDNAFSHRRAMRRRGAHDRRFGAIREGGCIRKSLAKAMEGWFHASSSRRLTRAAHLATPSLCAKSPRTKWPGKLEDAQCFLKTL